MRDSCGRLTAHPAESEHLERKSTSPNYVLIKNNVYETTFCKDNFLTCLFVLGRIGNVKAFHLTRGNRDVRKDNENEFSL